MNDDDLWGFGEEPEYEDSSADGKGGGSGEEEESDPEYMLPEAKRQKLRKAGIVGGRRGGRGGGRRGGAAPRKHTAAAEGEEGPIELSDSDSDKALLCQAGAAAAVLRATAASMPEPRQARLKMDPRAADMLRQAEAAKQRLAAAAVLDDDDDEEEEPDVSPLVMRGSRGGQQAAQRQQQRKQQGAGGEEGIDLTAGDGSQGTQEEEEGEEDGGAGSGYAPLPAAAAAAAAAAVEDRIPLKLRSNKGDKYDKTIRIIRTDPLSKLFAGYKAWAVGQGLLPSADAPVRFMFDGDRLSPDESPADLDLEGDEVIDVYL